MVARRGISGGALLGVFLGGVLVASLWGFTTGRHTVRRQTTVVPSPTTAVPYAEACEHGVRVFTTPQGGIAVFAGGSVCP